MSSAPFNRYVRKVPGRPTMYTLTPALCFHLQLQSGLAEQAEVLAKLASVQEQAKRQVGLDATPCIVWECLSFHSSD